MNLVDGENDENEFFAKSLVTSGRPLNVAILEWIHLHFLCFFTHFSVTLLQIYPAERQRCCWSWTLTRIAVRSELLRRIASLLPFRAIKSNFAVRVNI